MITDMRLRHGPPSMPWMLAVVGAATAGMVALSVVGDDPRPAPATRPSGGTPVALERYAAAIAAPTRRAGRAIIAGIRPDISDFRTGRITADVWRTDMEARAKEFATAWSGIAAADRPTVVASAQSDFDEAFRTYLLAVRVLYEAGAVEGDAREELISWGAQLGDDGDAAFDRAAAVIQRARRDAGLLPDENLPDPEVRP